MKVTIVIASLLGVFLASALANRDDKKNLNGHHHENSHHSDSRVHTGSKEGSEALKSVWDVKTGYVATKVFSKHTCIVAKMDRREFHDKGFPALHQEHKELRPQQLPPRENRFIISKHRLQSLRPYGRRIQALCRGVPSYFAYPAVGSNFLEQGVSCLKVKINGWLLYHCNQP